MINFDTWLKQVEDAYGAKIVDWMIPFAKRMFDDFMDPQSASNELVEVWLDHNND